MVIPRFSPEYWATWPGPMGRIPGHLRPDIKERTKNGALGVTNVAQVVLEANEARKHAVITNDSTAVIYLAIGGTAAVNTGIRLNAAGGALTIDENFFTREKIEAVAGAAGPFNLCWTEID